MKDILAAVSSRILQLSLRTRQSSISSVQNLAVRKSLVSKKALKEVPVIKDTVHMHEIDPEATLDGEDVLYTGKHLLIGLSHCTKPTWCRCPKQRVFRKVPRLHYTESLGP